MAQNALTRGSKRIGINESTDFRIVITGLEVIQFGLILLYSTATCLYSAFAYS